MRYLMMSAAFLAFGASSAFAAGENLTVFTAIDAQGQYRVEVTQGDHYSVQVEGNDASRVGLHVVGHSLQLRQLGGKLPGDNRLQAIVHVTMPSLSAIESSRGIEFFGQNLRADQLAVHGAMGTEMHLNGTCGGLTVSASMGAEIDAANLDCASATAEASMGGEIRVHARQSATASASMGGEIHVSGKPQQRTQSAGLGGEVSFE